MESENVNLTFQPKLFNKNKYNRSNLDTANNVFDRLHISEIIKRKNKQNSNYIDKFINIVIS